MTIDEFETLCVPRLTCRDCGVDDDLNAAGLCHDCWRASDEFGPPCGDPRPDPRTHPEFWTE